MLRLRDGLFSAGLTKESEFLGFAYDTTGPGWAQDGAKLSRKIMIMNVVTNPAAGETIVVGGKTYTFRVAPTLATEIKIGNLLDNADFANGNDGKWGGRNWTVDATGAIHTTGPASGTVDSVADYSATVPGTILITDTTHGLSTGDVITIAATSSYNGTFIINRVDANTFYIYRGWVSDQSGTWASETFTQPLTQECFPKVIAGHTYVLGFTVGGWSAGTVTPYVGQTAGTARGSSATFAGDSIIATDDEYIKFVPSADFDGKISAITLTDAASDLKALTAQAIAKRINLDTVTSLCTAYCGKEYVGYADGILVIANTIGVTPTFTANGVKVVAGLAFTLTLTEAQLETVNYFKKDATAEKDCIPTTLTERNSGEDINFLY